MPNQETVTKKDIVANIREVAAALGCAPSRDQFRHHPLRKYSDNIISAAFGNFTNGLTAAGFATGPTKVSVTSPEGLKTAQLTNEVSRLNTQVRELEAGILDASKIREMIGAVDTTKLGEDSAWIKGARRASPLTGIPVLFLSDIHFDEVVKPEQIGHSNAYNRVIATERLHYTFKTAVHLLKRHMSKPKYDGIVLALGGDLLSGNIHEELAETNEASINQSVFALLDILVSGVELLIEEFGRVFVPCVVGNHGRLHRKPRAKNRVYDNFEWLIYQFLARRFKNDERVSFYIPDGADAIFEVYGKRICLTHGDQFMGGTGIAGIFSPLMLGMARKQRRQQAMNKPFGLMLCGHWHQLIMTETLIINGSVKGADEYSYINNFPFEKPQQACFIVHRDRGVTFRMPIICNGYETKESSKHPPISWTP
jgi:predicted phosphodiesterase